jgi:hypothetical protein
LATTLLEFLNDRANLWGQGAAVPHLSPTTLTNDERAASCATAGNTRDHTIISLALAPG